MRLIDALHKNIATYHYPKGLPQDTAEDAGTVIGIGHSLGGLLENGGKQSDGRPMRAVFEV